MEKQFNVNIKHTDAEQNTAVYSTSVQQNHVPGVPGTRLKKGARLQDHCAAGPKAPVKIEFPYIGKPPVRGL